MGERPTADAAELQALLLAKVSALTAERDALRKALAESQVNEQKEAAIAAYNEKAVEAAEAERDALRERLDRLREAVMAHAEACDNASVEPLDTREELLDEWAAACERLDEAIADTPTTWRAEVEAAVLREAADGLAGVMFCASCGLVGLEKSSDCEDRDHVTEYADADDVAEYLRTMATTRGAK